MNCEQAKDALQGLIDDALAKDDRLALREHLKSCSSCRNEYRLLRAVSSGLSGMRVYEPGPGFNQAVFRRLGLECRPYRRPAWLGLAMAASISLAVFWLTALAAALPTLLMDAKAYRLAQWVNHPELVLPSLQAAILKTGLAAYQALGFAAKIAGWSLKTSTLPAQAAVAGMLAFGLILMASKVLKPRTSM